MTGATARCTIALALAGAGAAGYREASSQEIEASPAEALCDGPVIGRVFVENHTIYSPVSDSAASAGVTRRFIGWLRSIANRAHRRTSKGFIAGELLFEEGDCFDPLLLGESERILRALPFIADSDVYAVPVDETQVHVVVDTHDEWTLKLGGRLEFDDRLRITQVSFTEENLMGTGTLLGAYLIEEDERRDLGLQLRALRLAGTRLDSQIGGGRTRTGDFLYESLSYPFVGEVGKWAFVESYSRREDLFRYASAAGSGFTHVNLPIRTRRAVASMARRFGTPGNLTIVGAGLSWDDVAFDGFPEEVTVVSGSDFANPDTADVATAGALRNQVNGRRAWRFNVLAGRRRIAFVTREGLDALRGEQDVRVGTQALATVATTVGTPNWTPDGDFHELRGTVSLFAGAAGDHWIVNSELTFEAARLLSQSGRDNALRDILGELGAYFYWQPPSATTAHARPGVVGSRGVAKLASLPAHAGGPLCDSRLRPGGIPGGAEVDRSPGGPDQAGGAVSGVVRPGSHRIRRRGSRMGRKRAFRHGFRVSSRCGGGAPLRISRRGQAGRPGRCGRAPGGRRPSRPPVPHRLRRGQPPDRLSESPGPAKPKPESLRRGLRRLTDSGHRPHLPAVPTRPPRKTFDFGCRSL